MPVDQTPLETGGQGLGPYSPRIFTQVDAISAALGALPEGTAASLTARLALLDAGSTETPGTMTPLEALVPDATGAIDKLYFTPATPAAAGSVQGNGALTAEYNFVTGADDTKAVTLPTAVAGKRVIVVNTVSNKHLHVFPATGAAINALGANNNLQLEAYCMLVCYAVSATLWWTIAIPTNMLCSGTELSYLDGATLGTPVASKAVVADASQNIGAIKGTSLALGTSGSEASLTSSIAELNTLASSGVTNADLIKLHAVTATAASLNNAQSFFDVTATATEVKSGTKIVVPAVTGKQFYPTFAAMQAAGSVTTATGIRIQESTSAGVVLGHLAGDMTSTTWVGPTGGTPTITKLNTACTVSEGLVVCDYTLNTLTVTTAIRCIVAGYYI